MLPFQKVAKEPGCKAIHFNFVASTKVGAKRLWNKQGFDTVGRLLKAFNHPQKGVVDALVWLSGYQVNAKSANG